MTRYVPVGYLRETWRVCRQPRQLPQDRSSPGRCQMFPEPASSSDAEWREKKHKIVTREHWMVVETMTENYINRNFEIYYESECFVCLVAGSIRPYATLSCMCWCLSNETSVC